jgi:hypothetical protein
LIYSFLASKINNQKYPFLQNEIDASLSPLIPINIPLSVDGEGDNRG